MLCSNHPLTRGGILPVAIVFVLMACTVATCQANALQDSLPDSPAESPASVSPPNSGQTGDEAEQTTQSQDDSSGDMSSLNPATVEPAPDPTAESTQTPTAEPVENQTAESAENQTPDSSSSPTGLDQSPPNPNAVQAFRKLVEQIASNENKINELYSTMPLGFAALQADHMAKIKNLKEQVVLLKSQLSAAALESFRAAPNKDVAATQFVFNSIKEKIDGSSAGAVFDPQGALDIAQLLMNNGLDAPQIAYLAFRASYAVHDFEQARVLLSRIEETGFKLSPAIREQLDATNDKWEREQALRRLEETADDLPRVLFETSEGNFVVELFENEAPKTVGNFISLVEKHFYDDLTFHLVKPGQIAQAGCPVGDGSGDAGYKIPDETDSPEIRHHFAGTMSMAKDGKDSAGSQFFISHQPNVNLDGKFTVFGVVIEGLENVYRLQKIDRTAFSGSETQPSKIFRATVVRKRDHEYSPTRIEKQPDFSLGN